MQTIRNQIRTLLTLAAVAMAGLLLATTSADAGPIAGVDFESTPGGTVWDRTPDDLIATDGIVVSADWTVAGGASGVIQDNNANNAGATSGTKVAKLNGGTSGSMPVLTPTDYYSWSMSIPSTDVVDLTGITFDIRAGTGSTSRWGMFNTSLDGGPGAAPLWGKAPLPGRNVTPDNWEHVNVDLSGAPYQGLTGTTVTFYWYAGSTGDDIDSIQVSGTVTSSPPATIDAGPTVEVSDNHSVFNVSVFPGKAGYDDGVDSGVFGDGTVLDYRFFNNEGTTFNNAGYADGGAGLVSEATATNSDGTNGGALDWADVWTTSDPDADPADFTSDTFARSQGVTGTIDISGLESGELYFIYGSFENPNTVALTMTGAGQPDLTAEFTIDPPGVNKAWISEFTFENAAFYDTISWTYTNTDTDGSRARFMGVVLDGQPVSAAGEIPEPATMALLGLAVCGLGGYVRKRKRA